MKRKPKPAIAFTFMNFNGQVMNCITLKATREDRQAIMKKLERSNWLRCGGK